MSGSNGSGVPQTSLTLGSRRDNDLVFQAETVSGYHARLILLADGATWYLEDLGSTNGTFVNGHQLASHSPHPIQIGDRINLGKTFSFVLKEHHLEASSSEVAQSRNDASASDAPTVGLDSAGLNLAAGPADDDDLSDQVETSPLESDDLAGVLDDRSSVEPNDPLLRFGATAAKPHGDTRRTRLSEQELAPSDGVGRQNLATNPEIPRQSTEYGARPPALEATDPSTLANTAPEHPASPRDTLPTPASVLRAPAPQTGFSKSATRATGRSGVGTQVLGPETLAELEKLRVEQAAAPPPDDAPWISIGYADDNVFQLKNPAVSSHHAKLYRLSTGYLLEDQGSTNGTWCQGARISRIVLREDEQFRVANQGVTIRELLPYFARVSQRQEAVTSEPLSDRPILIGRSPKCDIRLNAPMVSSEHAMVTALGGGRFRVEDLGSTNGSYLNSRDNKISAVTVGLDDVVFLGSYRLPISRLQTLVHGVAVDKATALPADKAVLVVGRDQECDIVLNAPQVSRRHAELRRLGDGRVEVRDLGSINGTYVNGRRIKTQVVTSDDLLSFASYRLRLDEAGGMVHRDYHGDIMLQAERITVRVRDKRVPGGYKTILDDASFTAYPTEFVGLMGPSGAGKTTLMLALNGYTPPTEGRSLLNGHDLYSEYNAFRGNIGYVPQDDIIYRQLTVFESLYYTAKLRLPPDTTDAEIEQKIDDILDKLEIQQTKHVVIGDALAKGISGGQRKRVNLAQELITEPSLLFLDEPTSGLASEDTINVMNLLRRLADEGRTILLTIHQPSLEAYRKLDSVIYLFQGRLVYYGPAYPDGISYFYPEVEPGGHESQLLLADPGNSLKVLAEDQREAMDAQEPWPALETVVEQRRQRFLNSSQYKDFVYDRAVAPSDDVNLEGGSKQKTQRRGWMRQWWTLTRRCANIKRKDTLNTAILLLQAPIIGLVLYAVFTGQVGSFFDNLARGPAALFLLAASSVWFGCSNSAREIVGEQAIYRRERMVNLMIPSYVLSKMAVLGVVCALQCGILLAIVYPALGFSADILAIYTVLLLASLAGVGMGLTLSAVARSGEAAMALVPLLLIPQIVLGGVIMPIHDLSEPMQVLSAAMVSRWGFEGLLHLEYGDDTIDAIRDDCGIDLCPDPISLEQNNNLDGVPESERLSGPFGEVAERHYFPTGEGRDHQICNVLCPNARRGVELTPLERSFGLDVATPDSMRSQYARAYGVGVQGAQTSLLAVFCVLLFFNVLMIALVCAVLRWKDVEVG